MLAGSDIVLTSYNLLQRDEEIMSAVTFDGVVLDEAQNIKNPTTRQSRVARTLRRDHLVGSIEVGKLADFVELSADPWAVDRDRLIDEVQVAGTWLGGRRIDLDEFLSAVAAASHPGLPPRTHQGCC